MALPNLFLKLKNGQLNSTFGLKNTFFMFKNCVIFLVLFALLGQMLSQLAIVAHFVEHRSELADLYCHHETEAAEKDCYGACYLSAELEQHDHEQEQMPSKLLEKQDFQKEIYQPLPIFSAKIPPSVSDLQKLNFSYQAALSRLAVLSVFHPPTV
jgi:hypothetical protein